MRIVKKKLTIRSEYLSDVLKTIKDNGGTGRVVGGIVRDTLANSYGLINYPLLPPFDIDIATSLLPEQIINSFADKKLAGKNIKLLPTGIRFGTVNIIIDNEVFEVTTLRRDIACNGRHAEVIFTDDFAEDAARRDFTINALNYCFFEELIYDYFDGINDLLNKKVVFIGNPETRLQEDYLRILRFFRFSSRFATRLDSACFEACKAHKDKLKLLSKERIKDEMSRFLDSNSNNEILSIMIDSQILSEVWPVTEYNPDLFNNADSFAKIFHLKVELLTKYAILFTLAKNGYPSKAELISLKFSSCQTRIMCRMFSLHHELFNQEYQDYLISEYLISLKRIWLEEDDFCQYFLYSAAFVKDKKMLTEIINLLHNLLPRIKPVFPLNGHDLLKLAILPKNIKDKLHLLKNKWIASDFSLSHEELIRGINQDN